MFELILLEMDCCERLSLCDTLLEYSKHKLVWNEHAGDIEMDEIGGVNEDLNKRIHKLLFTFFPVFVVALPLMKHIFTQIQAS